jgi:hypothetical protein
MLLRCVYLIFLFCVLFSNNAYAYLDPGSGSLLAQIIIAALAAIPLAFSQLRKEIFMGFRKIIQKLRNLLKF